MRIKLLMLLFFAGFFIRLSFSMEGGMLINFNVGQYGELGAAGSCTAMDVSALGMFLNMGGIGETTKEDVVGIIRRGAELYRAGIAAERPGTEAIVDFVGTATLIDPEFSEKLSLAILMEKGDIDNALFIERTLAGNPELYNAITNHAFDRHAFLSCDIGLIDTYNRQDTSGFRLQVASDLGLSGFYQGLNQAGLSGPIVSEERLAQHIIDLGLLDEANEALPSLEATKALGAKLIEQGDLFARSFFKDETYSSIDALVNLFDGHERIGAVYTVPPYSYAIGKRDGTYFVFDSHTGVDAGGSHLVLFGNKDDFLAYLKTDKFKGFFSAAIVLPS